MGLEHPRPAPQWKPELLLRRSYMRRAFTLIELLVVVTIIVVLLALLTPALDRAIYVAELALCGTHARGIAVSVQSYAAAHKRFYPYRPGVELGFWSPNILY